jgi:mevalonate kinase (EC 2.7.1.36)
MLFDAVADVVYQARRALAEGEIATLGPLLDRNQALLEESAYHRRNWSG